MDRKEGRKTKEEEEGRRKEDDISDIFSEGSRVSEHLPFKIQGRFWFR